MSKETSKVCKIKKQYIWIGIGIVVALAIAVAIFVIGNNGESPAKDSATPTATSASEEPAADSDAALSDGVVTDDVDNQEEPQTDPAQVKPKYADAEIYEKEGKKYSKTEDGTEVELSGENLESLMAEYALVQGTDSEEEKELLDRIQVILDNAERLAE